jgi:hypothetical protein
MNPPRFRIAPGSRATRTLAGGLVSVRIADDPPAGESDVSHEASRATFRDAQDHDSGRAGELRDSPGC